MNEEHGRSNETDRSESRGESSGDIKGKDKDTSSPGTSRSMADRLQASGRLALNAVTGGPDLAGQQAGEKGSASFGSIEKSSSTAGEASSHRLRASGAGESIRTQPSIDSSSASQAFNEFASAEPFLGLENNHPRRLHDLDQAVVEQERADGAAVVDLLNGPSGELDAVLMGSHHDTADDDDRLSPEKAAKLREALFNSTRLESRWDDMLNFTPSFLRHPGASQNDLQLHLGTADPDEAQNIWLRQWGEVLSSYTDQVWGDLGPLAAEARREVEELTSNEAIVNQPSETKALDRLRQILAHVRGH